MSTKEQQEVRVIEQAFCSEESDLMNEAFDDLHVEQTRQTASALEAVRAWHN